MKLLMSFMILSVFSSGFGFSLQEHEKNILAKANLSTKFERLVQNYPRDLNKKNIRDWKLHQKIEFEKYVLFSNLSNSDKNKLYQLVSTVGQKIKSNIPAQKIVVKPVITEKPKVFMEPQIMRKSSKLAMSGFQLSEKLKKDLWASLFIFLGLCGTFLISRFFFSFFSKGFSFKSPEIFQAYNKKSDLKLNILNRHHLAHIFSEDEESLKRLHQYIIFSIEKRSLKKVKKVSVELKEFEKEGVSFSWTLPRINIKKIMYQNYTLKNMFDVLRSEVGLENLKLQNHFNSRGDVLYSTIKYDYFSLAKKINDLVNESYLDRGQVEPPPIPVKSVNNSRQFPRL